MKSYMVRLPDKDVSPSVDPVMYITFLLEAILSEYDPEWTFMRMLSAVKQIHMDEAKMLYRENIMWVRDIQLTLPFINHSRFMLHSVSIFPSGCLINLLEKT